VLIAKESEAHRMLAVTSSSCLTLAQRRFYGTWNGLVASVRTRIFTRCVKKRRDGGLQFCSNFVMLYPAVSPEREKCL
jgi:hypothetical protein